MSYRQVIKFFLVSIFPLLLSAKVHAQERFSQASFTTIEEAIREKRNLQDVSKRVYAMLEKAKVAADWAIVARSYNYLLQIADQRSEDSLFFKNALFIDSILQAPASPPLLQSVMHLMKAKRLSTYIYRFSYQSNRNLTGNYNTLYNYIRMDRVQLERLAGEQYDSALRLGSRLPVADINDLLWLSDDPLTFLFKPGFADLVYAARLAASQRNSFYNSLPRSKDRFLLSPDTFMQLTDTVQFTPLERPVFRMYQQWADYHRLKNREAYYFIESLARKFFYDHTDQDSATKQVYENYLQQLALSTYPAVRVHAIYQLSLLWNNEAEAYNPAQNSYNSFHGYAYYNGGRFDSTYRLHYNRVLDLYVKNERLLDSFRYIKVILAGIKQEIEAPGMIVSVSESPLPGRPAPAFVQYRNITRMYMRTVKISYTTGWVSNPSAIAYLMTLLAVSESSRLLTLPPDHQWHNTYTPIDPLPEGRYVLLYSDAPIEPGNTRISFHAFQATGIAAVTNSERVFVLDRQTGRPVAGAALDYSQLTKTKDPVTGKFTHSDNRIRAGREGWAEIHTKEAVSGSISSGRDTAGFTLVPVSERSLEYIYNKDEDDRLLDYYEDNIRLELFTDRAIYRPGQRVYFKGIFTVRHPKTGELLVLNWHNLRLPFYQKIFFKLMLAVTRKKIGLYVSDPFKHTTDTLKVIPNKFGSVTGSFLLSKNAPTGSWSFDADDLETSDTNSGEFSVEEYKRPSFELKLDKPRTRLYLGDSFRVKAKVVSFAGSQLSGVRVRYSVTDKGSDLPALNGEMPGYGERSIISNAEGLTDAKGELVIQVADTALQKYQFSAHKEWYVGYQVEATAIDGTGESHEASVDIKLSTRPLKIRFNIPGVIERSRITPLPVFCESDFEGAVTCPAEVRLYRKAMPAHKFAPSGWPVADIWLHPEKEQQTWFPDIRADVEKEDQEAEQLVYTTSLIAGGPEKLAIPPAFLITGEYHIQVTCRQAGKTIGETDRTFSVFDQAAATWPAADKPFEYLAEDLAEKGKQVSWVTGVPAFGIYSIYQLTSTGLENGKQTVRYEYAYNSGEQLMHTQLFTIPENAVEKVLLTHFYLYRGTFYKQDATVWIAPDKKRKPEIIIEQYCRQLVPGGRQTFSVSVKTGSGRQAAELMTTMYDASLDKLEKHEWKLPEDEVRINVSGHLNGPVNEILTGVLYPSYPLRLSSGTDGRYVWWMNTGHVPGKTDFIAAGNAFVQGKLSGRVAGLAVSDGPFSGSNALNDVVVVGYGIQNRRNLTGAAITIRGAVSMPASNNLLVVIDGVPFEGDLSKLEPNQIVEATLLKGADATALYGNRAATGAFIISTKGPLHLPGTAQEPPPPVIRKNFAETAFFFPEIHAGKHGLYSFNFTLPESVTSWNWKMLAHTKTAAFVYAERTLTSQLPLMVQPSVPRFLYQGDQIMLRTRISNLDTTAVTGVLKCMVEDVVTGRNMSTELLAGDRRNFTASARSSTNGSFRLTIPIDQLNPIRIRITGTTNAYGDGEEYVIPVLARKMLVTRSVPLSLKGGESVSPDQPPLPDDAEPYGLGLSVNPQPRSALLNALPYLALYPYGCAEQTFGKMLAHAIAIRLMQTDTAVQQSYRLAVAAPPSKEGASIPGPAEESMPWLQLNQYDQQRQRNLVQLLDTNDARRQMQNYFRIIQGMQQPDGGISWFKGGSSSEFVSAYLLAGFGKMLHDHLLFLDKKTLQDEFPKFLSRLMAYSDGMFSRRYSGLDQTAYLYSRSFWLKEYPPADSVKRKADSVLNDYWMHPPVPGPGLQAAVITAILKWAEKASLVYRKAAEQLESIRQLAITDTVNGVRWKAIADQYDLTLTTEERVAKVAEAFETAGAAQETISGIIKWLVLAKQEHRWSSTKSTAEVVGLIIRQPTSPAEPSRTLEAELGGKKVQVTNDLMSGHAYQFVPYTGSPFPAAGRISAPGPLPVNGALSYYYFTAHPPIDSTAGTVQISKALYKKDAESGGWQPVLPGTPVSIADKIKVTLTVSSAKLLQFVLLEDKRAAALEPSDGESGYRYDGGLYFYRSVRDASTAFFFEKIPAGTYTISYETVVAKEGNFTNGSASLQCMYQPAVQAYSGGGKLAVNIEPASK